MYGGLIICIEGRSEDTVGGLICRILLRFTDLLMDLAWSSNPSMNRVISSIRNIQYYVSHCLSVMACSD